MLTLLSAIGLHQVLPIYSAQLWFPLSELATSSQDILALKKKDDDFVATDNSNKSSNMKNSDKKNKEEKEEEEEQQKPKQARALQITLFHHFIR